MFDNSTFFEKIHWNDPISITKEQWMFLLRNKDIVLEKDIQLLTLIYESDMYMATASQLAQLLNIPHYAPLNSQIGRLGKRIVKTLNIQAIKQKETVQI